MVYEDVRLKDASQLSHISSSYIKALICIFVAFISLAVIQDFRMATVVALLPFLTILVQGLHLKTHLAFILWILWCSWMLLLFSPLGHPRILGRYYVLMVYLPFVCISLHSPHRPTYFFVNIFEPLLWDMPLLVWIKIVGEISGQRALAPFYSDITNDLCIGSIPILSSDIAYLSSKNVGMIVNMCREWGGT